MTYQTLYKVTKNGDVEHVKNYNNSFLGAYLVWDKISRKYIDKDDPVPVAGDLQPVWDLWKNPQVPLCERVLMLATFDNIMLRKENFGAFIDAMGKCDRGLTGHFYQNAKAIKEMLNDDDCIAVCWNQTSVNADAWQTDGRPYNVNVDSEHWFLFDDLQASSKKEGENENST